MTDPEATSIPGYEVRSNTKLSDEVHRLVVRAPGSLQYASRVSSSSSASVRR